MLATLIAEPFHRDGYGPKVPPVGAIHLSSDPCYKERRVFNGRRGGSRNYASESWEADLPFPDLGGFRSRRGQEPGRPSRHSWSRRMVSAVPTTAIQQGPRPTRRSAPPSPPPRHTISS